MAINRLIIAETLQKIGKPGVAGIALLAFSLSLVFSMLLPSWQEFHQLKKAANHSPDEDPAAAELQAFYKNFPLHTQAPESLSYLYIAAKQHNVRITRGQYALAHDVESGMLRYRIALPVQGTYGQIREFVATALQMMPTLALDEISFERPQISTTRVDARISLVLYLKPGG